MSESTLPLPVEIGPDGHAKAIVSLTPTTDKVRREVHAPPDQAIPIIFLPGVMGSPLLATGDNKSMVKKSPWAWFPDSKLRWVAGMTPGSWMDSYRSLSPAKRKKLLNPDATRALTKPGDADLNTVKKYQRILPVEEMLERGWGSVSLDSYGDILNYLETQLRFIVTPTGEPYPGIGGAMPRDHSAWGHIQGYTPLDREALGNAADFMYPVYAMGYNWLHSNSDAADRLADYIGWVLNRCQKKLPVRCKHGVILVTHSMGGLVARMCAKRYPDLIQGIVHSVQPAIGSATAYRRVRAGWEDVAGAIGLGGTAEKITPIFANASGPLELLPTKRYGAGWLRATYNAREVFSLPSPDNRNDIDPYGQIYLEPNAWWRLVNPVLIDPIDLDAPKETAHPSMPDVWRRYREKLLEAQGFHLKLGDYYHPNTYVHYGADDNHRTFHRVTWAMSGSIPSHVPNTLPTPAPMPDAETARSLRLRWDNLTGRVTMTNDHNQSQWINQHGVGTVHNTRGDGYMADLQGADKAGDGTVPSHSAEDAANHAVFSARMSGYDHQGSYQNDKVQHITLYAVLRIGATAKVMQSART